MPISSRACGLFKSSLVTIALFSLWIRMAFPLNAIGWAGHDDVLFLRLAANIGFGGWLGAYDNLTHAKGIVYSLFIVLNHAAGTPLKFSEHAFYLAAALYFALTVGTLCRSRSIVLAVFALLAFNPVLWNPGVGGRVVRENIYASLSLLMMALAVRCWVLDAALPAATQLRAKWRTLVALGLVAGAFWLTREEGLWLAPSMLVLAGYWAWKQRRGMC